MPGRRQPRPLLAADAALQHGKFRPWNPHPLADPATQQIELGSIALPPAEDEEIELLDWTAAAAQSWAASQDEVAALRRTLADREAAFARLKAQLADVAAAKSAHEDALLVRFAALLNAKKRKVRDLQRVLAGAPVGPAAAAARGGRGAPRGRKRKGEAGDDDDDDEEDEGGDDDDGGDDTQASTDEGSSESDDAFEDAGPPGPGRGVGPGGAGRHVEREASPPPAPAPKVRRAIGGRKKAPTAAAAAASRPAAAAKKRDGAGGESHGSDVPMGGVETEGTRDAPPPRRELPFRRPEAASAAAEKDPERAGDEDDDETDDEL